MAQGQIDAAREEIEAAQSRTAGAEAAVQSAIAERASAQAALDRLLAGATVEEIAMARARVASAMAALGSAQAALDQSQIRAPMDGQIGTINLRIGEMATPERFVILLGQTDDMHVETTDLRETDVVNVSVGHAGGGDVRRAAGHGIRGHGHQDRAGEQHGTGQHQLHSRDRRGVTWTRACAGG